MIMTFGKFAGHYIEDIPSGYLEWVIENLYVDKKLGDAIETELDYREQMNKY